MFGRKDINMNEVTLGTIVVIVLALIVGVAVWAIWSRPRKGPTKMSAEVRDPLGSRLRLEASQDQAARGVDIKNAAAGRDIRGEDYTGSAAKLENVRAGRDILAVSKPVEEDEDRE
jgi:hypothetical protein